MITRFLFLLFLQITVLSHSFSQITGKVVDSETHKPLPGASVVFVATGEGTATGPDGIFWTDYSGIAEISVVGYRTRTAILLPQQDTVYLRLDPDSYYIDEIVVEAFNRSRRLVDIPGSLTMIQRSRIERENPVTIVPVLNHAPGIFAHSGALNTSRITIRGIGARVPYATGKVRAYLNNIPLTNGSGISIIEDIDPSLIERAEIIKGPATSVYGAGLGGTVLLKARAPSLLPRGIQNSFHTGSWNLYRNSISMTTGTDRFGLTLQHNHTQSTGYRQNNEYRRDGFSIVSQANPSDNADITLLVLYTGLKAHIPSSIDSMTFVTEPGSAAQNWLRTRGYEDYDKLTAGISAGLRFANSLRADLAMFSMIHDEKELRPFDVRYEERISAGSRLKISHTGMLPSGSWQMLAGGELFFENFGYRSHENIGGIGDEGALISDNSEFITYYNLFTQADIDLYRLRLSTGINFNSGKTDFTDLMPYGGVNPSGIYSYGNILSPRISLNYRYYRSNSLFMTISHGFSPPALDETLTPDGFINPEIKPERSWNIEGGLRGNLVNHRLFYDINIYSMRVSDLLVAERVAEDAWIGKNAGESLHRGLEVELQMVILSRDEEALDSWWKPAELTFSPNYTFNNFRFTDFIDDGTDHSGNLLPGIPGSVFNAGIYGSLYGGLYAIVNFRAVGRMPMNDENSLWSDSYFITGATAGIKHNFPGNISADLWFSAGNIFNQSYASMILVNAPEFHNRPPRYYYPGNPLNFSGGIRVRYLFN